MGRRRRGVVVRPRVGRISPCVPERFRCDPLGFNDLVAQRADLVLGLPPPFCARSAVGRGILFGKGDMCGRVGVENIDFRRSALRAGEGLDSLVFAGRRRGYDTIAP